MNRERIQAAIETMRAAEKLDMRYFQQDTVAAASVFSEHLLNPKMCHTVEELHACGNTACFAGYVALTPEFKEAGGTIDCDGWPIFNGWLGDEAIASYLGISRTLAADLVQGDVMGRFSIFYGNDWSEVTPADVIEKLEAILAGGLS